MNGGTLLSIGDLARRTGLTVKAIRFYSDRGIVPPDHRSPAGHRRYGADAVARLRLVRTLRALGVDLPTIRLVLDRDVPLAEVAAAHAEALAVQIRTLRSRRAVLTAVAGRGATQEEMELMHELALLAEDERRRLVDDFLGGVFRGLDADPAFTGIVRSLTPELPDDPEADQVDAWVELATLSRDPDFRAYLRRLAELHAAERARHGTAVVRPTLAAVAREHAGPAQAAGVDPTSAEAGPVVAAVVACCPEGMDHLLSYLTTVNDPRRERYLHLLAVINGWSSPESQAPAFGWLDRALRARVRS